MAAVFKQTPRPAAAYLPFADALIGSARLDDATAVLREATAEKRFAPAETVEAHYTVGLVLTRQDKYPEAITELRKALQLDPKAGNAHLILGGALLQLKQL